MKSPFFLKTILVFALFVFSSQLKAQEKQNETYVITDKAGVTDVQPYIDALNKSDMRYHRLRNTRFTIVFNTGVKVELFSAKEINSLSHPLTLSDYPESFDPKMDIPIYSLGPNNFIMEQHHMNAKFH